MKNIHLSATDRKDIETGLRKGKTDLNNLKEHR